MNITLITLSSAVFKAHDWPVPFVDMCHTLAMQNPLLFVREGDTFLRCALHILHKSNRFIDSTLIQCNKIPTRIAQSMRSIYWVKFRKSVHHE